MNSIDEILDEVARATELNNGNIIARACASIGVSCPKCNYPANARLFDTLVDKEISKAITDADYEGLKNLPK